MGRFKLTLPWAGRTVIGQVVAALRTAGLAEIVVVVGHRGAEVEAALTETAVRCVFNPNYADGEMLSSVQAGLAALDRRNAATLLCLGDQPQLEPATTQAILAAGQAAGWQTIVIPSYQMHAGHPILLPRWLWDEILACRGTLRETLARHRDQISYLVVQTPTVLADLDTPEDYQAQCPKPET